MHDIPSEWTSVSGQHLLEAAAMFAVFIGVLLVGSKWLPGRRETGGPDLDGDSRTYTLNGLTLFVIAMLAAVLGDIFDLFSLSVLHSHFAELFIVANVFAFSISAWLYYQASRQQHDSPGSWRGLFFGRQSNPSWLGVDLKLFSYRPSLISLALFNVSFAAVQYDTYGEFTLQMILYQVFTLIYVLNYFQFEYGMIYTWDIVSERFGWMLAWGDYVLVPFFYCLGGWWVLHATDSLPAIAVAAICFLFVVGYITFRGANEQKHRFKQDADVSIWGKPAESLDGRLLVSGFWGVGRHLNYTGEICVYFAWVLTTAFMSWIPFALPVWLAALLWHRSRRDDRRCRTKYGELWERYTQRVPHAMIPKVY
jgi:delta14-sterol reductase